jgi:hypothetical protein
MEIEISDLIFYGIGALIVIGSWIGSAAKKAREMQERRRRALEESLGMTSPTPGDSAAAPQSAEPKNLTMAQMSERQRAKAYYEQRVRVFMQGQASTPAEPSATPTQTPRLGSRRGPILVRRPAPAEVPAGAGSGRRSRQPGVQRPTSIPGGLSGPEKRVRRLGRPVEPAKSPAETTVGVTPATAPEERDSVAHRLVADITAAPEAPRPFAHPELTAQTLRDAVILKELLDPPVALRPPGRWR